MTYDPYQIEAWKKDTIFKLTNEYLTYVKHGYWPTNFTSCSKYNKMCQFYNVCRASGDESKEFILESTFVEAEPYDKYGKDEA